MRTDEMMEYKIYPRIMAVAERAWHQAGWEQPYQAGREYKGGETHLVDQQALLQDWQRFANLMGQRELAKMDKSGVAYRVPQPGARVVNGTLETNVAMPGLIVEYSVDGGKQWQRYDAKAKPSVNGEVQVRTASPDGKRFSRVESVKS